MTNYAEEIRKSYKNMESDELIARVKAGTLTEEANILAIEELSARGLKISESPQKPQMIVADEGNKESFLWRCWHGKERLGNAFWILGLLGGIVVALTQIPTNPLVQVVLFIFIALPVQIFWWVSVWRCAFRTSIWIWSVLARSVVFLGVYTSCFKILKAFLG